MVRDVNATQLEAVDVLSDHPYLVEAETLKISNPCDKQEELVADHHFKTLYKKWSG